METLIQHKGHAKTTLKGKNMSWSVGGKDTKIGSRAGQAGSQLIAAMDSARLQIFTMYGVVAAQSMDLQS